MVPWKSCIFLTVLFRLAVLYIPPLCPNPYQQNVCYYDGRVAKIAPSSARYFAIGGLFDIHRQGANVIECSDELDPSGILLTEAFLWAVNYYKLKIATQTISVGAIVFDNCHRTGQVVHNILGFEQCQIRINEIDRYNLVGFVGPTSNDATIAAARLTSDLDLTLISPSADSTVLSQSKLFPYFLRSTPSMQTDIDIMADILIRLGTKFVAVFYEMRFKCGFACFQQSFSASFANVVAAENALVLVREEPRHPLGISDSLRTAVSDFKEYWSTLSASNNIGQQPLVTNPFMEEFLASGHRLPDYRPEAAYTILAVKALMEGTKEAGREICQDEEDFLCSAFFDMSSRGTRVNVQIRLNSHRFKDPGQNGDLHMSQIHYSIHRFTGTGEFVKVAEFPDGMAPVEELRYLPEYRAGRCHDYPCLQCHETLPTTTTTTTAVILPTPTNGRLCMDDGDESYSKIYYPRNHELTGAYVHTMRDNSEYTMRFDNGQNWIIALGFLVGFGLLSVVVLEIYIVYKLLLGTQMGRRWRTIWLGQLLLFGVLLSYLTLLAYLPIPTKATCAITRMGVGVSCSLCFAVLLVKLMVIFTSRSSESGLISSDIDSQNYLKGVYQLLMIVFIVAVQVAIDTQWLIMVPPHAVKATSNVGEDVWICNHFTFRASGGGGPGAVMRMSEFVRNEFENHVLSLVYVMFLILLTALLSLKAHGIVTNHRESVFIGISAGFSIPVWLAWGLLGELNRHHDYAHEFGDACIAFGLFLTSSLILFSMFLPKVRQLVSMGVEGIYFEDDQDTFYASSVIMAPQSFKPQPNSALYPNQSAYSDHPPVVISNVGDMTPDFIHHHGNNTLGSSYSAPPYYLRKGVDGSVRAGSVLRVTNDLSGRRQVDWRRPASEAAYGTRRPRSEKAAVSQLGAL